MDDLSATPPPVSSRLPLRRFFVEGVVVVGSILLAFGIDAWWDRSRERIEERVVLSGIVEAEPVNASETLLGIN